MSSKYNNDVYSMYEEEYEKNKKLIKEMKHLKLDNSIIKNDYEKLKNNFNKTLEEKIEKATSSLVEENNILNSKLNRAYEEIDRLKSIISNSNDEKDYKIDKLESQLNKDSTNSGIPTSKEIRCKHQNKGANTYNHREKTGKRTGGQIGHPGSTLTKEQVQESLKNENIKVKKIVKYINGPVEKEDIVKFRIGLNVEVIIEEYIFKHDPKSKEKLPKEFYSDVTYNDELKSLIVILGNYYCLGFRKVNEILSNLSNGIIDISDGTIDNIYDEFSNKSTDTVNNIMTNLRNGKYQHTDETITKENGREVYFRGYANKENVVYKYHHKKGDDPIEEDGIITDFFGTVISDHEPGIFKYGTHNQDCVIHIGRYCIEAEQNVIETQWQMEMYRLLLKVERERQILKKFGRYHFTLEEIKKIENEYDEILRNGEKQNKEISSTYWKEKEIPLLNRLRKYKKMILFYIYDFDIPMDNNFMERALRMIKGKTKVSGGFRSDKGGERFGNIMTIIKTSKLRKLNPFICIKDIYQGKSLFA